MKVLCAFFILLHASFSQASPLLKKATTQKVIANVSLFQSITVNQHKLFFNGAEMRNKLFIDLYVAALYSQQSLKTAKEVLDYTGPSALEMIIVSELITSPKMQAALKNSLQVSNEVDIQSLEPNLTEFTQAFNDPIKPNDKFTILSEPKLKTITVFKNGLQKVIIQDEALRQAVLNVWLGTKPIQYDLKYALLTGQASMLAQKDKLAYPL